MFISCFTELIMLFIIIQDYISRLTSISFLSSRLFMVWMWWSWNIQCYWWCFARRKCFIVTEFWLIRFDIWLLCNYSILKLFSYLIESYVTWSQSDIVLVLFEVIHVKEVIANIIIFVSRRLQCWWWEKRFGSWSMQLLSLSLLRTFSLSFSYSIYLRTFFFLGILGNYSPSIPSLFGVPADLKCIFCTFSSCPCNTLMFCYCSLLSCWGAVDNCSPSSFLISSAYMTRNCSGVLMVSNFSAHTFRATFIATVKYFVSFMS